MDHCHFTLAGKRILIVDDDSGTREVTRTMLNLYEAEVLVALDGADGLDQVQKHKPDVIVSDITMPNMDGYQFLREVRGLPHIAAERPRLSP